MGNNVGTATFRVVSLLLGVVFSTTAGAHAGPLDGSGCHKIRTQAGGYHCHGGAMKGETFASREAMLKELHRRERQADAQRSAGR